MIIDLNSDSDVALLRRATTGQVVGLTSGSYDLFHNMHLVYLRRCRRLCDVLIVGVDSDDLTRQRKGPSRPTIGEHQRVDIVSALNCVHAAFVLGSVEDFGRATKDLNASVIFKNEQFGEEKIIGSDSARVVIVPDMPQHGSTSAIIEEVVNRCGQRNPASHTVS